MPIRWQPPLAAARAAQELLPDATRLTIRFAARCVTALVQRVLSSDYAAGFQTPAHYGRRLLAEIEGATRS